MKGYRAPLQFVAAVLGIGLWLMPSASPQSVRDQQIQTNQVRQSADYERREAQASPQIKAVLSELRSNIQAQRLTFQVGYTEALDRPLNQLAGLKLPADLPALAQKQNALADQLMRIDNLARDEYLKVNRQARLPELTLACNASLRAFDWRLSGKVSPVRDQGGCGSCWDFATMGAFEGSYLIRNGGSVDSSEQDVLDCNSSGYSCAGGFWAFDFVISKGDASEGAYPYTAVKGPCKSSIPDTYNAVTWGFVKAGGATPSVAEMKQALCQHGPLAIAVRVTSAFQAYTSGVFNEHDTRACNHGVTLIGWDDSKGAWLIKNSWGKYWGDTCGYGSEKGYMWIAYGSNNIGTAAAWVQAKSRFYILPPTYYKLMPEIRPVPEEKVRPARP
jgi:cathepsin L